jgi:hypothetical protein
VCASWSTIGSCECLPPSDGGPGLQAELGELLVLVGLRLFDGGIGALLLASRWPWQGALLSLSWQHRLAADSWFLYIR